jgi:hypothetical protein
MACSGNPFYNCQDSSPTEILFHRWVVPKRPNLKSSLTESAFEEKKIFVSAQNKQFILSFVLINTEV